MRKTILATSIMFSALLLGSSTFVESTVSVMAVNQQVNNGDIVENKIRFEEEDGAYVYNDDSSEYFVAKGKIGDKINWRIL